MSDRLREETDDSPNRRLAQHIILDGHLLHLSISNSLIVGVKEASARHLGVSSTSRRSS